MSTSSLGLYVLASLALIATPGQDMIYVITRSLAQGRFAGLCSAVGVGAILQASESLFVLLKLAGAAYLVYLGLRLVLSRDAARIDAAARTRVAPFWLVWQGVLSNVTNPKIVLFFFAFLPQFVDPASARPTRDLAFLGVLYALLALPVKAAVGLAAGSLSERVLRHPSAMTWMNRVSGGVLIALGLRLAATDRS